jgi:competence protein ComEC
MKDLRNAMALLVVAGAIFIAAFFSINPLWWLLLFGAFLSGAFVVMLLNRRRAGWLIFACIFCIAGFWFSAMHQQYRLILHWNRTYHKRAVTLTGVQISRSETTLYGVKFLLQVNPPLSNSPRGKIMVYYRGAVPNHWYGRRLRISGKFGTNPDGGARFPDFIEKQGITGNLFVSEKPFVIKGRGLPFPYIWANRLRELMLRSGYKHLSPINARLLHGMVFNDRLSNEPSDRKLVNDLRRTGTIHLVSVSGMHVGFLVISFNWFLGWLRVPKKWRILPLTAVVWFYIMMTGMNPPVLRAGVMMMICSIGDLLGGGNNQLNRLALAALALLFGNPYQLFEISFQLSFVATLGVVWLYPLLKEYFPVRHFLLNFVWKALLLSVSAQLMVTPMIVYYFQQIAWIGPFANLLFLIPAEIIVIGGLIGESIAILLPWVGQWILLIVDYNLTVIRWIAYHLASQSWAASWSPVWPWPWIAGFYVAVLLGLDLLRPNLLNQKRLINFAWLMMVLLGMLNLLFWNVFFQRNQGRYLQFTAIDVGQGDALFVEAPDGHNLLVDGGDEGRGIARVLPFLRASGVERLNLVIATHGHRDHISGLAEVLEEIPAQKVYLPVQPDTVEFKEFFERLRPAHLTYQPVFPGEKFTLGTAVRGEILAIPELVEENDRSLVVLITYGKNRLLLTGDLGEQGEAILARKYPKILRSSVLKVGHHGSKYASGLEFITQVKPKAAIISVGTGNRFGHPGANVINRLRSLGVHIYRTDRHGSVTFRLYGERILATRSK